MKVTVKFNKDASGQLTTIEISQLKIKTKILDGEGSFEYRGPDDYLPMVSELIKRLDVIVTPEFDIYNVGREGGFVQYLTATIGNGTVTMYTVPQGKKLFFGGYDCQISLTAAIIGAGYFYLRSPINIEHPLVYLYLPANATGEKTIRSFSQLGVFVPAGWSIRAFANANIFIHACMWGFVTNA